MTYLAVSRIHDERLFCLRVLADHIRGTGLDAGPAADTAFNRFDGHGLFYLSSLFYLKLANGVFTGLFDGKQGLVGRSYQAIYLRGVLRQGCYPETGL